MLKHLNRGPAFYRYLWRLSLPIILQNLITFSLGLIDTFMVSRLGNEEMAAVTAANVPVFLLLSLVFGLQSGLGILVSQYWGKGDVKSISRAIGVASMIGAAAALVLAIVFWMFPVQVMDLLSNKHELSVLGAPYLRWIGFSYFADFFVLIYVAAHRSTENPKLGLYILVTGNTEVSTQVVATKQNIPAGETIPAGSTIQLEFTDTGARD
jgi:Na+-driven multidrug efflux pump